MKELELKIYNSCMSWLEEEGPSIVPVYQFQQEPEIVEKGLWDHCSELPNPSWYEYKDVIEKKKYPDNVVYNNESGKFDSNTKSYPTTVGSQKFEPIVVDKSDSLKVNKHLQSKFEELKGEWDKLVEEYEWTSLVYKSNYSFQPILGEPYHLYHNTETDELFLSLIGPTQWDKIYMGTFILLNNGKWEKV